MILMMCIFGEKRNKSEGIQFLKADKALLLDFFVLCVSLGLLIGLIWPYVNERILASSFYIPVYKGKRKIAESLF